VEERGNYSLRGKSGRRREGIIHSGEKNQRRGEGELFT